MKSIILCCNYNEEKTGNLERCLKSLQQNRLENTIIGIIDNGSKDNSINLISDYVKNKTVDVCIQSLKNLGKPKALNSLFKYMLGAYEIRKDDLCIHLDSDIKIYNNFIKESENCFEKFNDCYLFISKGSNIEEKFNYDNGHWIDKNKIINVNEDFQKIPGQLGIQGCVWTLKCCSFLEVNLYRENRGKNGKSAIYGGDDGFLAYDLLMKNKEKFIYMHKNKFHFHPPVLDKEYKKWKDEQNILTGKLNRTDDDFKNLAEKGFYD